MKKYIYFMMFTLFAFGLSYCTEDDPDDMMEHAILHFQLSHQVNGEALQFNTQTYQNALGEYFVIQDFKYYLSNIKLRNTATGAFYLEPDSYHLVQPVEGEVFDIVLENIPPGEYNEIEFAIGVDNAANTSTDRLGALDPSNEMAWDWNTGYKFLLLEGRFGTAEDALTEGMVYHIGGDPTYRTIRFNLSQTGHELLRLQNNDSQSLDIGADVGAIFAEPTPVSLAEHPVLMHDPFSVNVADNYATHMFELSPAD